MASSASWSRRRVSQARDESSNPVISAEPKNKETYSSFFQASFCKKGVVGSSPARWEWLPFVSLIGKTFEPFPDNDCLPNTGQSVRP
jgi:hypothetical protein